MENIAYIVIAGNNGFKYLFEVPTFFDGYVDPSEEQYCLDYVNGQYCLLVSNPIGCNWAWGESAVKWAKVSHSTAKRLVENQLVYGSDLWKEKLRRV